MSSKCQCVWARPPCEREEMALRATFFFSSFFLLEHLARHRVVPLFHLQRVCSCIRMRVFVCVKQRAWISFTCVFQGGAFLVRFILCGLCWKCWFVPPVTGFKNTHVSCVKCIVQASGSNVMCREKLFQGFLWVKGQIICSADAFLEPVCNLKLFHLEKWLWCAEAFCLFCIPICYLWSLKKMQSVKRNIIK